MPAILVAICYLIAFVCFLAGALGQRAAWYGRVNLIGLGLAFWILPLLWNSFDRLD